ncbi:chorismate mutase [Martiniozyma asiatica (nom. inval.)]|nr:chorismate mutase [Martiniozyma asiatica]
MNFHDPESVYNLANIRTSLIRMEDTIIFTLIERSDFPQSPVIYSSTSDIAIPKSFIQNGVPSTPKHASFLDWLFSEHEHIQSQVRRFQSPDQLPFYPQAVVKSFLPPIEYPKLLANYFREINVNSEIMNIYLKEMIPGVAIEGEDSENIGSTAMADMAVLQALSRRIHFGMFVAEAKYRSDRDKFRKLIESKDIDGISNEITNAAVEQKILERLVEKAEKYGTDPVFGGKAKVEPEVVVGIYRDWVIPLTKKVEVEYLLRRLEDDD